MIGLEIEDEELYNQISGALLTNKYVFCKGYYCKLDLVIVQGKSKKFMDSIISGDVNIILVADDKNDKYIDYSYYALLKPLDLKVLMSLIKTMDIKEDDFAPISSEILMDIGVSPMKKGYQYLKDAVNLYINHKDFLIKDIYVQVAMLRETKPQNVERNIRYAIETAFDKCRIESQEKIFRNSIDPFKGKPTNMELICRVADLIELGEDKYEGIISAQ